MFRGLPEQAEFVESVCCLDSFISKKISKNFGATNLFISFYLGGHPWKRGVGMLFPVAFPFGAAPEFLHHYMRSWIGLAHTDINPGWIVTLL